MVQELLVPVGTLHYQRVRAMMRGFGQATPDTPEEPNAHTRLLRVRLILEEALEVAAAAGVVIRPSVRAVAEDLDLHTAFVRGELAFDTTGSLDVIALLDGLCDLSVVNTGTFVALGVPDEPFLAAVDANNLRKIATGRLDERGKFIKAPDHPAPRLAEVLAALAYQIQPQQETADGSANSRSGDAGATQ